MAPKRRVKRSRPCSCGCGQEVRPSRVTDGKSWRVYVQGRYLLFYATQCLVQAAETNVAWRPTLAAALSHYLPGRGNRGVVASALAKINMMDAATAAPLADRLLPTSADAFDPSALARYMDLLLLGLLEWHVRLGVQEVQPWYLKLLGKFPGQPQWLRQRWCTVWALLDTTAIFLISHYIRRLPPARALLSIVIATVCHNSWKVMLTLFGASGVPHVSALQMARLHTAAQTAPAITLSPTGGLTGSGRLTLGAFAQGLGLQRSSGNNTEHFHIFIGQLYAEHCSTVAAAAWASVQAIAANVDSQASKNQATLQLLRDTFFLYGLCQEHVARLVGLLEPRAYDCSISTFVEERACLGLRKLLRATASPHTLRADLYSPYLQALGPRIAAELPSHTAKQVGRDAWSYLEPRLAPGISSVSHLQLHEHNCCEFVKNDEPQARTATGNRGNPTPQYAEWTRAAYPTYSLWAQWKKWVSLSHLSCFQYLPYRSG